MNSNSSNSDIIITPDQIIAMQQRLIQLEQLYAQSQAQPSAEPQSSTAQNMTDMDEQEVISALHSLEVRPSYSWSPSPLLAEILSLNDPLFTSPMLSDEERRKTIEKYPNMDTIHKEILIRNFFFTLLVYNLNIN